MNIDCCEMFRCSRKRQLLAVWNVFDFETIYSAEEIAQLAGLDKPTTCHCLDLLEQRQCVGQQGDGGWYLLEMAVSF